MGAGILSLVVAIGVGLPGADAQDLSLDQYAAIVEQFRSTPERAIEQATALSPSQFRAAATRARAGGAGWTPVQFQAAMLVHLEAAFVLARRKDERVWAHIQAGGELGEVLGRNQDHAWFVHRWYMVVLRVLGDEDRLKTVRRAWTALPWNAAIVELEIGLRFEYGVVTPSEPVSGIYAQTLNSPKLPLALRHLERGAAAGVLVAALHAGRLRMLQGDDTLARRHFEQAATSSTPSTRYLAHLFLGSLDERDGDVASAERHYVAASSAFPYAQSGRVALAALLARSGRGREAVAIVTRTPPAHLDRLSFDPWWLFLPPNPFEVGDTIKAMYAEVQQ